MQLQKQMSTMYSFGNAGHIHINPYTGGQRIWPMGNQLFQGNHPYMASTLLLKVKKSPYGWNRIVAIETDSVPPFCICSVYTPSRSSKSNSSDSETYLQCLDQVEEILNIYSSMHAVVIHGDMNASLIPRKGNLHDSLLMDFVERNNLSWRQNGEETLFHPNKADKAEIDYVFFNKNGNKLVQSVAIERHTSLNKSNHLPVCAQVNAENNEKVRAETTVIPVKPKGDKCDKTLYKNTIFSNSTLFYCRHHPRLTPYNLLRISMQS